MKIIAWIIFISAVLALLSPIVAMILVDWHERKRKMKAIKCLVNLGGEEDQERLIEIPDNETEEHFEMELSGYLPYMCEFRTTKGEIISGGQIICKL